MSNWYILCLYIGPLVLLSSSSIHHSQEMSEEKSTGQVVSKYDMSVKQSLPSLGHDVILSLSDEYYKNIMWKHYRMLGKDADTERKNQVGKQIFFIFQQRTGSTGKFFKRMQQGSREDFEVDANTALESE